ncbi:M20/M25/M40 family metallo-hydrolase [Salinibacter ruber]|uniref:M20/M25/M40 family metallo-hydrolase n=1 Tax=Salinibacter ruber TaxID=146919 RepID=UPI001F073A84|nr:M20/M25/M40 family metallo-hydrolase [Salinibacter ruber]
MLSSVSPVDRSHLPDPVANMADEAQSLAQVLVGVRRYLHRHPEVGMEEHNTSRFIRETLEGYGLDVYGPIAGTGLYVDIEGSAPGGAVGYRADIDALPTQDQKQVPYRSQTPNVAHLCGHDAHTAIAIGVALVLHNNRDQLQGRARVFFQPNEEGLPSGAPLMIRGASWRGSTPCTRCTSTRPWRWAATASSPAPQRPRPTGSRCAFGRKEPATRPGPTRAPTPCGSPRS